MNGWFATSVPARRGRAIGASGRLARTVVAALLVCLAAVNLGLADLGYAAELSARDIIAKVDANAYMESAHIVARLVIKSGRREMVKVMESWVVGDQKALVVFLNPEDKGTKYLKIGDDLWMYFPDAEDLVKISGHMLRQGMMGSDISYQDALESEKMAELYDFKIVGRENYGGADCYVIEATALPGKNVTYSRRKMWIDARRFIALREELYAASGKLLKVSRVEEVREQNGRVYAGKVVMEDQLKKDSSTTMVIEKVDFSVKVSDEMFSLRNLSR